MLEAYYFYDLILIQFPNLDWNSVENTKVRRKEKTFDGSSPSTQTPEADTVFLGMLDAETRNLYNELDLEHLAEAPSLHLFGIGREGDGLRGTGTYSETETLSLGSGTVVEGREGLDARDKVRRHTRRESIDTLSQLILRSETDPISEAIEQLKVNLNPLMDTEATDPCISDDSLSLPPNTKFMP
jgi:hypothetical protein